MPKPIEARKQALQQVRLCVERLIPPSSIDEPKTLGDKGSDYVRVVNPIAVKRYLELHEEFLRVNAYTSPSQRRRVFDAMRKWVDTERSKRGWKPANKDYAALTAAMSRLETLLGK